MRRYFLTAAVIISFGIDDAGTAPVQAGGTPQATIAVTATVLSFCTIAATPIVFGNYTSAAALATSALTISCTSGTTYTVGLDQGIGTGASVNVRQMTNTLVSTALLGYAIYSDSNRTVIWGNTISTNTVAGVGNGLVQTLTAYGKIPAGQFASPGLYSDTVTATLTY